MNAFCKRLKMQLIIIEDCLFCDQSKYRMIYSCLLNMWSLYGIQNDVFFHCISKYLSKDYYSHKVCVYGDGVQEKVNIDGDILSNKEELIEKAKSLKLPQNVEHTKDKLLDKLYEWVNISITLLHTIK